MTIWVSKYKCLWLHLGFLPFLEWMQLSEKLCIFEERSSKILCYCFMECYIEKSWLLKIPYQPFLRMLQEKVYSTLLSLWYNIQCKRWIFVVQRETQAGLLVEMGILLTAVSFGEHEQCLAHCWGLQHSCRANGDNIVTVWSSVVQVVIPVQQHTDEKRLWKGARELLLIVGPRWEWVPPAGVQKQQDGSIHASAWDLITSDMKNPFLSV